MSSYSNSPHAIALHYISHPRFHRRFTLPATADHDTLTVTYADIGSTPDPPNLNPPTILFMPGMFASRYTGALMHAIAEKLGVRVLVVDRPGMGNSTDVPLDQRLPIWLELVPRLLTHLGIEHVALISHSLGTIYLLNTLFYCRQYLHPVRPFVAFLAPWVHPSHSGVTSLQMAQYVPTTAFGLWHLIPKLLLLKFGPVITSSGVAIGKISNGISSGVSSSSIAENAESERNRSQIEAEYGISRDVQVEIYDLMLKRMFGENTVGANSEALQGLRKGADSAKTWGKCEDNARYVRELVEIEKARLNGGGQRLKVRAYFAGSDSMIGEKGREYVEKCWSGDIGECEDALDFEAAAFPGLQHDSLVESAEVWKSIFLQAGGGL